jgi:hypothetical protein
MAERLYSCLKSQSVKCRKKYYFIIFFTFQNIVNSLAQLYLMHLFIQDNILYCNCKQMILQFKACQKFGDFQGAVVVIQVCPVESGAVNIA